MRESASACLQMNGFDIKDVQGRYYASLPSLFLYIYSLCPFSVGGQAILRDGNNKTRQEKDA